MGSACPEPARHSLVFIHGNRLHKRDPFLVCLPHDQPVLVQVYDTLKTKEAHWSLGMVPLRGLHVRGPLPQRGSAKGKAESVLPSEIGESGDQETRFSHCPLRKKLRCNHFRVGLEVGLVIIRF